MLFFCYSSTACASHVIQSSLCCLHHACDSSICDAIQEEQIAAADAAAAAAEAERAAGEGDAVGDATEPAAGQSKKGKKGKKKVSDCCSIVMFFLVGIWHSVFPPTRLWLVPLPTF